MSEREPLSIEEVREEYGKLVVKETDLYGDGSMVGRLLRIDHVRRLKRVVQALIDNGHDPSPKNIEFCCFRRASLASRHRATGGDNLNGRDTRARREVLEANGWLKNPSTGRWEPQ